MRYARNFILWHLLSYLRKRQSFSEEKRIKSVSRRIMSAMYFNGHLKFESRRCFHLHCTLLGRDDAILTMNRACILKGGEYFWNSGLLLHIKVELHRAYVWTTETKWDRWMGVVRKSVPKVVPFFNSRDSDDLFHIKKTNWAVSKRRFKVTLVQPYEVKKSLLLLCGLSNVKDLFLKLNYIAFMCECSFWNRT